MKSLDVIPILESLSRNPDQALDINQVHALIFAVAVIHSLPENTIRLIDSIFDLAYPEPKVW
ncbi:hypothetical protein ES703_123962 [subsurface metagenome]